MHKILFYIKFIIFL